MTTKKKRYRRLKIDSSSDEELSAEEAASEQISAGLKPVKHNNQTDPALTGSLYTGHDQWGKSVPQEILLNIFTQAVNLYGALPLLIR